MSDAQASASGGATFQVAFAGDAFPPVRGPAGEALSVVLDAVNSPVLFGCRTGICGTCAVEVLEDGGLEPASAEEREFLECVAPDNPRLRLACQLRLTADCRLAKARA